MKIVKIEDLHCDAGWRVNSFLKITTDEGIVGWSEYMEGYGAQGLTGVIRKIGRAPDRPGPAAGRAPLGLSLRRDAAGRRRRQRDGDRRDRERAGRHQGQGVGRAGLRDARRPDPRPAAALLVALRHLPRAPRRRRSGNGSGSSRSARSTTSSRLGAEVKREGLQGPQDQHHPLRRRAALYPRPRHQRRAGLSRAEHSTSRSSMPRTTSSRRSAKAPARDVGAHLDTNFNYKIDGYVKLARALEPLDLVWLEIDIYDPAGLALIRRSARHADLVLRVAVRQAPVPAVFRAAVGRLRDHRRGLERHPRIGQDRRDGRRLRGQCRAAQFQRPSRQPDQRAFLRRGAELQGHGDRHRRHQVEGRHRHRAAGHRGRRSPLAERPRAGAPTSTRNSSARIRREDRISNRHCEEALRPTDHSLVTD